MDDTSSNGPLAAVQAWNEKQATEFRRSDVKRSFEEWWALEGCNMQSLPHRDIALLAWFIAALQAEVAARDELRAKVMRIEGGAK
jgi:ferritin-like protein